ncbi:MAG: membrane-bound O-acyltransferase family protein [Gammaproteobacteria bacterium]|nr:MAG: membrane-bound O-acyltransferase family protein [Gammaproteobacteria bacterium]
MLFNSPEFLFLFLPLCLFAFSFSAKHWGNEAAIGVLVFMSLVFYAYWNPVYLLLIIGSMIANFKIGHWLGKQHSKPLLALGVALNLGLLGYYKYANFFVDNVNYLFNGDWHIGTIVLPLAISFFTFQQIAYLVDSYQGITREYSFLHYALFVSFFPQLIAGPIVHHKEMLPQFESRKHYTLQRENIVIGLSIFAVGLFKKTVLADGVADYANPVFNAADAGQTMDFFTAWGGTIAYTLQLYFDFSGYSDMAIGLARLFGIILPLNFYSPYKAANISEFWRRWHMTLSRFLRDYVYIAMGGNRKGEARRYFNLMATMFLGGLWHGAGWNFAIWGTLHGGYLVVHQLWSQRLKTWGFTQFDKLWYRCFAWLVTIIAVMVGWVYFRAVTLEGANTMLTAMAGMSDITVPNAIYSRLGPLADLLGSIGITANERGGSQFMLTWLWIACLTPIVLIMPNTQDMFAKVQFSLSRLSFERHDAFWPLCNTMKKLSWKQTARWAVLTGLLFSLSILTLTQVSEFMYFQF